MKIVNLLIASMLLAVSAQSVFAQANPGEGAVARERTDSSEGHSEMERARPLNNAKTDPNCRRSEPTVSPEGNPSLHNLPLCDQ